MANQQTQSTTTNQAGNQPSLFERMLMQMMLSNKMNARERAGASIGNVIAALLKNWRSNYDFRGYMKDKYFPMTPEDRLAEIEKERQRNPQYANRIEAFLKERLGDQAFPMQQQAQATAQPQATPQVSTPIIQAGQQYAADNLPTLQQQQGLLGTLEDWDNAMKKYLAPFSGGGWNAPL